MDNRKVPEAVEKRSRINYHLERIIDVSKLYTKKGEIKESERADITIKLEGELAEWAR